MKKLYIIASFIIANSALAQEACMAIDTQELKELSAAELKQEYCTNWKKISSNADRMLDDFMDGKSGDSLYAVESSKCRNQITRLERALTRQGVNITARDCNGKI